ncbi:MAG: cell division protein FtsQ/DivIB [Fusobacteriaceae bacterium]|nr:cell division protein FtsQ/DivIB [Fusobacteriaceae bacterium]
MLRFLFRISLIFAVSFLFYSIPDKFFKLPFFKIKNYNIVGNTKISQMELTEIGEITYNSNIWEIDVASVEKLLKKDVRIEDAVVWANAPDEITFKITERETFAYVQLSNKIYLLDENGILFGFLNEKEKKNMPLFILNESDSEKYEKAKKFIEIIKLLDKMYLKDLISQIYEIDMNCIDLILTDGTTIRTNMEVQKNKYKTAEVLYYELIKSKKIEYIDLRFDNFVVKEFD